MDGLIITDSAGTVHRVSGGQTCTSAGQARKRKWVTPNQCLVYKLAPCGRCWPQVDGFDRAIGRRAA